MYVVIVSFDKKRSDLLVVGPYLTRKEAEAALTRERGRRSNEGNVSIAIHFLHAATTREVT